MWGGRGRTRGREMWASKDSFPHPKQNCTPVSHSKTRIPKCVAHLQCQPAAPLTRRRRALVRQSHVSSTQRALVSVAAREVMQNVASAALVTSSRAQSRWRHLPSRRYIQRHTFHHLFHRRFHHIRDRHHRSHLLGHHHFHRLPRHRHAPCRLQQRWTFPVSSCVRSC